MKGGASASMTSYDDPMEIRVWSDALAPAQAAADHVTVGGCA